MLSIIVSSVSPDQNEAFKRNIRQTIGDTPFEFLIHDNRETRWGLCELYNRMARKSTYGILCFLHEDILFHTQDWGKMLVDFFNNTPQAGVVGFAGATLKTRAVSGWGGHKATLRKNLVQHRSNKKIRLEQANPQKESFSQVAIVDGMALIVRRSIWERYPFDELIFRGFHLYDLDFSMQIAQHRANYVCHTILVEHLSGGSYSEEWYRETLKFNDKWNHLLPFRVYPYPESFIRKCEDYCAFKQTKRELRNGWDKQALSLLLKERLAIRHSTGNTYLYNLRLIGPFIKRLLRKK